MGFGETILLQEIDDFFVFREAAAFVFGENLPAVGLYVVDTVAAGDQLHGGVGKFFFQFGLQTGGAGQIVSLGAVGDFDFHFWSLLWS